MLLLSQIADLFQFTEDAALPSPVLKDPVPGVLAVLDYTEKSL